MLAYHFVNFSCYRTYRNEDKAIKVGRGKDFIITSKIRSDILVYHPTEFMVITWLARQEIKPKNIYQMTQSWYSHRQGEVSTCWSTMVPFFWLLSGKYDQRQSHYCLPRYLVPVMSSLLARYDWCMLVYHSAKFGSFNLLRTEIITRQLLLRIHEYRKELPVQNFLFGRHDSQLHLRRQTVSSAERPRRRKRILMYLFH